MSRNAAVGSIIGVGVLGVGYFVSRMGSTSTVGQNIMDDKEHFKQQLAQKESIRAGKGDAYSTRDVNVQTKGGDKGIKSDASAKMIDITNDGMGNR